MNKDILLLFPPFSSKNNPYLSIPVLARYLKNKNIPVFAEDIGVKFWNSFLKENNLKESISFIESRFLQLNEKQILNFKDIVEYSRIVRLLTVLSNVSVIPDNLLINLKMHLSFPDFYVSDPIEKLFSKFNEFSSKDILESINYNFFYSEIVNDIVKDIFKNKKPLIVAISLIFQNQVLPAFYIASLVKKYSPETHVAIGGPYLTLHFGELKNKDIFNIVDSLIMDEGEIPLEKLYYELQKDIPDFKNVPNLMWFNGKKIIKNRSAPPVSLNKLECPDYSIMSLDEYRQKREEMIFSFRLSRGCYWQQCAFCRTDASFCKNYAQPEYESIFNALLEAYEKYNARNFLFSDESAHPNLLEYLSKKIIKHKLDISWFTHTRFHDSLTRDKFKLFKEANCSSLTLGLESYNDRILKLMKKGISTTLIDKVINENNGILPLKVYMIMGFPTETEEDALIGYAKIKQWIEENKIIGKVYSLFQLNYGSDMWYNYKDYGIEKINIKEDQDLLPDLVDIECKGMSRSKANEYYLIFSDNVLNIKFPEEFKIRNKTLKVNYDVKKLISVIEKESLYINNTTFEKWLENTDITVKRG